MLDKGDFDSTAIGIFNFQYKNNEVYKAYTDALHILPSSVNTIAQIPFLPVSFFRTHEVKTTSFQPEEIFESSGTTGAGTSRHMVKDLLLYEESFTRCFEMFYGPLKDLCIIGLLPSYLERKNSSLIYMVEKWISRSEHSQSGFYLNEYNKLVSVLNELESKQKKTLLIGVSFALIDLATTFSEDHSTLPQKHTIIMETGGMKGRRREMIKSELHEILKKAFQVSSIHSEYGMTELLSQAYSGSDGIFKCPPWMKVLVRNEEDPLEVFIPNSQNKASATGAINIIDLANLYSCSFIATDDAGKVFSDGSFEVLGRMDNSDLRGCSLMVL